MEPVLVAANKVAFLNFFYIPVLVAAYFLGRRQGMFAALMAILLVTIYAILNPAMLSPTSVKDALNQTAPVEQMLVQGWVRTRRDSKDFSFIELNDGSSLRNLQIIARHSLPNYTTVQRLTTGD